MGKHQPGPKNQFQDQAPPNKVTIGDVIQKLDRKIKGATNSGLQIQDNLEDAQNLLIALVQMYENQSQYQREEMANLANNVVHLTARVHDLEDLLTENKIEIPKEKIPENKITP